MTLLSLYSNIQPELDRLPTGNPFQTQDILALMSNILGWILLLAAVFVFLCILISGVEWMSSGMAGSSSGVESSRGRLTACIIGFAILASSYAIAILIQYFLGIAIIQFPGTNFVAPPGPPGSRCSVPGDCDSGICTGGICQPPVGTEPKADGETCTTSGECQSGKCGIDGDNDGSYIPTSGPGTCYSTQNDCHDQNSNVQPDDVAPITDFYPVDPIEGGPPGLKPFDYNCDGIETPDPEQACQANTPLVNGCYDNITNPISDLSSMQFGWVGGKPNCGELGQFLRCVSFIGPSCNISASSSNLCSRQCRFATHNSFRMSQSPLRLGCR